MVKLGKVGACVSRVAGKGGACVSSLSGENVVLVCTCVTQLT